MWLLQVTDIEPDSKVRTAMNEINAAQRMRMAAKEKAEADRVMVVTRAQGAPALPLFFLHFICCLVIGKSIGKTASIPWSAKFAKRLSNISDVVLQVMLRPSILRYDFCHCDCSVVQHVIKGLHPLRIFCFIVIYLGCTFTVFCFNLVVRAV